MKIIDYNDIINYFDNNIWDFSYLTSEEINEILNFPIKFNINEITNLVNGTYEIPKESIILIVVKYSKDYDYSIDKDFDTICKLNLPELKYEQLYCNLKYAAVKSGLGQYGKNMVFHHPKFNFDVHLAAFILKNPIINLPVRNSINLNFLKECDNCNDCYNACPAHAIHNQIQPFWVDAYKCDAFCYYGNHAQIPSVKWNKIPFQHGIFDKDLIFSIHSNKDYYNHFPKGNKGEVVDNNGNIHHIHYPICRECTSQPKCSKYNGNYPYDWNDVKVLN